jgi:outer membrane lipoprotein carrier protein
MKQIISKKIIVICVALVTCISAFAQPNKDAAYEQLIGKYGKITSVEANISDGSSKPYTFKAKSGNKYFIAMGHRKIFCNGKTIWSYDVPRKTVVITDFKPDDNGITIDALFFNLLDKMKPVALKSALSTDGTNGCELELQNTDKTQAISSINLALTRDYKKITAIEVIGKGIHQKWNVSDLAINNKVDNSIFDFEVPKNVETIDMR